MIHELLGGAGLLAGERKISINGGNIVARSYPSLTTSSSPSLTSSNVTSTAAADTSSNSESQNLRCPRCDSSNTKFCYYNNYNLTQPRHFCKTCRRYWTKGGALRNVPIGGGCRKNKNVNVSSSVTKASAARMKTVVSEIGRSALVGQFDQELPVASSPILWGSPQNSHLLALQRAKHNTNPNPSSISVIENAEGNIIGTRLVSEPLVSNNLLSSRVLDSGYHLQPSSLGLWKSSLWRNNQCQPPQHNGTLMAELPNDELQELYQRLRSSSANNCADNSPLFLNNPVMSSSSFFESTPVTGSELGYGSSVISSWFDIPRGHY